MGKYDWLEGAVGFAEGFTTARAKAKENKLNSIQLLSEIARKEEKFKIEQKFKKAQMDKWKMDAQNTFKKTQLDEQELGFKKRELELKE